MKTIILNFIAVIGGLLIGSIVNMGLISVGGELVPLPEGADVSTMEGLADAMQRFQLEHFIFPFLAHALGTFAGAAFAAKVAATHHLIFALVIGVVFLAGGSFMVASIPSPIWFNVLDLAVAYIPMAYLAYKLVTKR